MDSVSIEVEILPEIPVTFTGEPEVHDDSFTHEFCTEVIKYWCVDKFTWDKEGHTEEEITKIEEWLGFTSNKDWICENLTNKIKR